ncbi:MAG: hypothetical protein ABFS46_23385, partial [Myxococcota bacterium]
KTTPVRLLGGSVVTMHALKLLPATPRDPAARKKRGQQGPSGSGVFPALARLGVAQRATPALREAVARQVAASRSVDAARKALERQGVRIDHKAALRLTYAFAEAAIDGRDEAMSNVSTTAEPTEEEDEEELPMAGRRLVVSLDGGRVRLKEDKPDVEPGDRSFNAQWREPKVLNIYAIDEHGKRDRTVPAVVDVTMGDADQVAALLVGHLRLLGAHQAEHVRFIADGGSWIWLRTEDIRKAAGIARERWSEQLDLPHLVSYLGRLIEPLTEEQIDRKTWLAEQKVALVSGHPDEITADLEYLRRTHGIDVSAALAFLERHKERLHFVFCRPDGQPLGSGGVESAIRRVVNLRVKGNSIYWLREHAEGVMHLRAHLVTGRWDELVARTLSRPVWQPRCAA